MNRLFTFYGDDFTGSTDVMEALASHGVTTALFTRIPTADEFAPFAKHEAIGLAGTSRSQSPEWMDAHLPEAFTWLKSLNARYCHYKICSTFDSAPHIGNIAKATEIGLNIFQQDVAPLLIGSPKLKRYTFAGHLFAAYQGTIYRIDRHPVMSVHPITPMDESDVLQHLARQGSAKFELFDVHDETTLKSAGEKLLQRQGFIVGSSGPESALMSAMGRNQNAAFAPVTSVKQLLVVSGSVSPTTDRQIKFATTNGFIPIAAAPLKLAKGQGDESLAQARTILEQGKSALIYTASGPTSDQGNALNTIPNARETLAKTLGQIARKLVEEFKLPRLVIAGGDTSSHALSQLDVVALTTRYPLLQTPGSPLCTAHSPNAAFNGLEIAMKGGQVGGDDYFTMLRDGINPS